MRQLLGLGVVLALATGVCRPADAQEHTTIGGYGEIHYANATGPNTPGQVNLARFVVYLAHGFNDRITFRSELEVEDAKVEGGAPGGEVALEQAYLDEATLRSQNDSAVQSELDTPARTASPGPRSRALGFHQGTSR